MTAEPPPLFSISFSCIVLVDTRCRPPVHNRPKGQKPSPSLVGRCVAYARATKSRPPVSSHESADDSGFGYVSPPLPATPALSSLGRKPASGPVKFICSAGFGRPDPLNLQLAPRQHAAQWAAKALCKCTQGGTREAKDSLNAAADAQPQGKARPPAARRLGAFQGPPSLRATAAWH